jgi:hypothetical protein
LADTGRTAWVACGVTSANVDDIEEVVADALCWGARGITFHLVEPAGRALSLPADTFLPQEQRVLLYAMVALLAAAHRDSIDIRLDLLHRETLLRRPSLIHAGQCSPPHGAEPARTMPVLVMYPDGTLLPVCHGMSERYGVGRLGEDPQRMWERFFEGTYPGLALLGGGKHWNGCAPTSTCES